MLIDGIRITLQQTGIERIIGVGGPVVLLGLHHGPARHRGLVELFLKRRLQALLSGQRDLIVALQRLGDPQDLGVERRLDTLQIGFRPDHRVVVGAELGLELRLALRQLGGLFAKLGDDAVRKSIGHDAALAVGQDLPGLIHLGCRLDGLGPGFEQSRIQFLDLLFVDETAVAGIDDLVLGLELLRNAGGRTRLVAEVGQALLHPGARTTPKVRLALDLVLDISDGDLVRDQGRDLRILRRKQNLDRVGRSDAADHEAAADLVDQPTEAVVAGRFLGRRRREQRIRHPGDFRGHPRQNRRLLRIELISNLRA